MKQLQIIGHLGQDAEIRDYQGKSFVTFTVAIDESYKTKEGVKVEKTDWISCAYENTSLAKYLLRGTKIFAQGNVKADSYKNKDGATINQLKMTCRIIELLSAKPQDQKPTQNQVNTHNQPSPINPEFEQKNEEDLPF